MTHIPCCGHDSSEHDEDEGCLHGWTATVAGCPCRPKPGVPAESFGILERLAAGMALAGATGFRRVPGRHDGRWRRNR